MLAGMGHLCGRLMDRFGMSLPFSQAGAFTNWARSPLSRLAERRGFSGVIS